jgi:predicted Zn-dependent protease
MKKGIVSFAGFCLLAFLSGCGGNPDDNSLNVFSVSQDKEFGKQLRDEILANTFEYPVWERDLHPEAYGLLDSIKTEILNSGNVYYKDEFDWELYIIHDDAVPNAFCAPGGYIFVFTGLMKYVHSVDELAGVLAHEIAHADRRHSTDQLTKNYGISILIQAIFGDNGRFVGDLTASLLALNYSRKDEKEADAYGVGYLCSTGFAADASKNFFKRLSADGSTYSMPTFLSTHPDDGTRVKLIEEKRDELKCRAVEETKSIDSRLQQLFLPFEN